MFSLPLLVALKLSLQFFDLAALYGQMVAYSYRYGTSRIDQNWYLDHALTFNKWQHPAVGDGERFDVALFTVSTWATLTL